MMAAYPGIATAHVLDDAPSAWAATDAAEFALAYHARPDSGWFRKAGNLNFGLRHTAGDLVLVLDADFAPRRDFLQQTLPYFEDQPALGILQTPQFFRVRRTQHWLERGAAAIQELFYRLIQVSRQAMDAATCVGTCAIYRRTALDDNGGFTLIEHSEDLHTGVALRRLGWGLQYVPIPLATGRCPAAVTSFYGQQYRWCSASLTLAVSASFWRTKMRPITRLCYLSGVAFYMYSAVFTIVSPLIPIIFLAALPEHVRWANFVVFIPCLVYTGVILPLWHRCAYSWEVWPAKLVCGWSYVYAIMDFLRGRQLMWRPTGALTSRDGDRRRLRWSLWTWSVGAAAAWCGLALWRTTTDPLDGLPTLAAGVVYAAIAVRAALPAAARPTPTWS
jgi:cellulose synthase (UDP-forming)